MPYQDIFAEWGINLSWGSLIGISVVITCVLSFYAMKTVLWRQVLSKRNNVFVHIFKRLSKPVQLLVFLTAAIAILNQLVINIDQQIWYQKLYAIMTVTIIAWIAIKGVNLTSDFILGRFDSDIAITNYRARRIQTQVRVLRRLSVALIILIGVASALMVFDQIRSLGVSLIASAGLAGIVIGLAAQKTLGNFFTGLQIAITQPIRIGDNVIVENEWGTIEEINLTYVVVKVWDLRRVILPISYFVDQPFQNWTRNSANLLAPVILYVDYTLPVQDLRDELDRIMETEDARRLWNGQVKGVQVVDATEKSMQLRVLLSADSAPIAWDLRCLVRERLIDYIRKNHQESLPRLRAETPELVATSEYH